jgi:FMN phosphatase YigB (HAD superfamily)
MKKIVLFDWGSVLCKYKTCESDFWMDLLRGVNVNVYGYEFQSKLEDFKRNPEMSFENAITDSLFDEYIVKTLNYFGVEPSRKNISNFKISFIKQCILQYETNTELLEYAYSLMDRVEVGILSNVIPLELPIQDITIQRSKFNYRFLSCEIGHSKPDKDIYKMVESVLGSEYEIMFIDDKIINLNVPKQLGWRIHHYKAGNEACIKDIEAFLQEE